ncbi:MULTISPECIES: A24 family peptidase [Rhodomicrobium]|uniref:prepilin peptidase n=1 Tax=Rhodomicrobium TaxID=1068 RepID=UPI000B4BAC16|nr:MULTISPECIES: A24 family peptidase [Rhodomicrobium]
MSRPNLIGPRPDAAPILLGGAYLLLALAVLSRDAMPAGVLAATAVLGAALVALSVIDLRTMRLPDAITLPLVATGPLLTFALGWDDPLWRIAAAAAGFLALYALARAYRALRGRPGLGLGDAKLFAAAGAWLGLEGLPSVMLWASGVALAAVLVALLRGQPVEASSRIPFGPFLALGFWIVWLFGPLG